MNLTGANNLTGVNQVAFDGHAHVFKSHLPMSPDRRYTPGYDAPMDTYGELLIKNGLEGAILVQPSFLGTDNRYLLNEISRCKQTTVLKIFGVVVIDHAIDTDQLLEFSKNNIVGIRLNLVDRPLLSDSDFEHWRPVFKIINRLGWHVELHCEGNRIPFILPKLLKYCDRIVVDHFGLPKPDKESHCKGQQTILKSPRDRIFVKLSAPYRIYPMMDSPAAAMKCRKFINPLLDYIGPSQLLWGSDWPWTQFENKHDYKTTKSWLDDWLQ